LLTLCIALNVSAVTCGTAPTVKAKLVNLFLPKAAISGKMETGY